MSATESKSEQPNEQDGFEEDSEQEENAADCEAETDKLFLVAEPTEHKTKGNQDRKIEINKMVQWTGYSKKQPVLVFKPEALMSKASEFRFLGEKYHLSFKFYKTECKLVRNIVQAHGFHEAHPSSNEFNLLWTGSHLKPYVLRSLTEFQKVNHFPRSYEITRKDRLYRNVQKMQHMKGFKTFDFLPLTFICPGDYQDFCNAFLKEKGTWIVKPVASSRGRGIFLISHPEQLPLDENYVVCKYIAKPLLVDGFKFDLRLYVAVTSFDPLVIYLYEEGLARFATVRYDQKTNKNINNQCMHLTNYSVNKKSGDFVQNEDAEVEDYGNKWSLGALLRCLRAEGHDTLAIMMRIEDVVIKTILSVEAPIATACKMFMPHRGNCFEVFGFDVLLDSSLRPWVLEVNLSPSLACDAPLDLKIKSHMISDLLSLTGFALHDPMLRTQSINKKNKDLLSKNKSQRKVRPDSAKLKNYSGGGSMRLNGAGEGLLPLTPEEVRIVRQVKEEYARRGGWVRIFPTPESWDIYSHLGTYASSNNQMLHQRLFPDRYFQCAKPMTASQANNTAMGNKLRLNIHTLPTDNFVSNGSIEMERLLTNSIQRYMLYERKLGEPLNIKKRKLEKNTQLENKKTEINDAEAESGQTDTKSEEVIKNEAAVGLSQGVASSPSGALPPQNWAPHEPPQLQPQKPVLNSPQSTGKPIAMVGPIQKEDESTHTKPMPTDSMQSSEKATSKNSKDSETNRVGKFDLIAELKRGALLTRAQARLTFSTYLTRVQFRLMSETDNDHVGEDLEVVNQQMDLVLRFLKRAAVNLPQPFKVVVPSRRLSLNDRRRMLAKQLGDFVHIYSKETEALQRSESYRDMQLSNNGRRIAQKDLEEFISSAEEVQLEQVLMTYTKINKSAAIFLGNGHSEPETAEAAPAQKPPSTQTRSRESNNTGIIVNGHEGTGVWREEISQNTVLYQRQYSSESERAISHATSAAAKSSFQNAIYVYSGKMAVSQPKQRPSSAASPSRSTALQVARGSRPTSASLSRRQQTVYDNSNSDVQEALQQLNIRQQERNYYSSNVTRVDNPDLILDATAKPKTESQRNEQGDTSKLAAVSRHKPRLNKASLDPYTFEHGQGDEALALAYKIKESQAAGNSSRQTHSADYIKQLEHEKQQKLKEQSKALLETSKAKHQAMIAQAHAATKKTSVLSSDEENILVPHPPTAPPSKPQFNSFNQTSVIQSQKNSAKHVQQEKAISYGTVTPRMKSQTCPESEPDLPSDHFNSPWITSHSLPVLKINTKMAYLQHLRVTAADIDDASITPLLSYHKRVRTADVLSRQDGAGKLVGQSGDHNQSCNVKSDQNDIEKPVHQLKRSTKLSNTQKVKSDNKLPALQSQATEATEQLKATTKDNDLSSSTRHTEPRKSTSPLLAIHPVTVASPSGSVDKSQLTW